MKTCLTILMTLFLLSIGAIASAEPLAAQVDQMLSPPPPEPAPEEPRSRSGLSPLRASVGVGLVSAPEFEGSDRSEVKALPMVDIRYDRFFLSWTSGLGWNVIDNATWTVAPALRYRFGRDEGDSRLLRGLGDLDDGLELGGRISWHPHPVSLYLSAFHGLGDARGYTVDLGVFHRRQLLEPLSFSLGASVMYADREYNQQFFGVTARQSAASGYQAYDPGGGLKHWSVHSALSWELTPVVTVELFGRFKKLTGPADDSPLVRAGSNEQFTGGLSLNLSLGD